jgi:hypothetical protein
MPELNAEYTAEERRAIARDAIRSALGPTYRIQYGNNLLHCLMLAYDMTQPAALSLDDIHSAALDLMAEAFARSGEGAERP